MEPGIPWYLPLGLMEMVVLLCTRLAESAHLRPSDPGQISGPLYFPPSLLACWELTST